MALTDRSNRKIANEHPKFDSMADEFKKHKDEVVKNVKMADISQKDIDLSKSKGGGALDLETAKMLTNNPTLTQKELDQLKKAAKEKQDIKPTGKFKE